MGSAQAQVGLRGSTSHGDCREGPQTVVTSRRAGPQTVVTGRREGLQTMVTDWQKGLQNVVTGHWEGLQNVVTSCQKNQAAAVQTGKHGD